MSLFFHLSSHIYVVQRDLLLFLVEVLKYLLRKSLWEDVVAQVKSGVVDRDVVNCSLTQALLLQELQYVTV